MKKIILITLLFALSGCCMCKTLPVRAISNEKGTNIYLNDEYQGADSTYVLINNSKIKESTIKGIKKGCQTTELNPEYNFDLYSLYILDIRNFIRLLTWDVYVLNDKELYNVTPRCE